MKQIKTNNSDLLIIKVPDKIEVLINNGLIHITKNNFIQSETITEFNDLTQFEILGKLSELTDKDLAEFVEYEDFEDDFEGWRHYKSYLPEDKCELINSCCLESIKESFKSLLQSNRIEGNEDELLIIKLL